MKPYIKEACVENLKQAIQAEKNGADRIELCDRLDLGGTTPSQKLIKEAHTQLNIPIRVMVRPRGGNFVYSAEELQQMIATIKYCKTTGVEGVVFGILDKENQLVLDQLSHLIELSLPMKVVIHKAIDLTPDPVAATRKLLNLNGITTILSSGGSSTAYEGRENLKAMIALAGQRFEIMPGGKVRDSNLEELHALLGATAYHGKKIVGDI